jgi:hypothetical protein
LQSARTGRAASREQRMGGSCALHGLLGCRVPVSLRRVASHAPLLIPAHIGVLKKELTEYLSVAALHVIT